MKRANFKTIYVTVICLIITLLCGCSLFVTDKDKFILDDKHENLLVWIDLDKTGSDVVIPSKVGDITVREIYLADPYYSKIDSLDVSNVKKLESFTLKLFNKNTGSKLKKLDFSKNNKLRHIEITQTKALKIIKFNSTCESIYLKEISIKKVDLKKLKKLIRFTYREGSLEELDISNNQNLESIKIVDSNVKKLDVSHNPKLKYILIDEGTEVIGPTNAYIEYNKRTE
ncbi:hypothetical protein [Mogibacterium diversum]|uniref:hypothetical protein n=1 Tax=Mogibacterium diversum TaxID=114527 RepID=UPI0028EA0D74|nr:hypothetical protein [Mogibacterium diversum]